MLQTIRLKMKKRKGFSILELTIYTMGVILFMWLATSKLKDVYEGFKRDATQQEIHSLAEACQRYETHSVTSLPPASLGDLVTGLTAAQSNDFQAHVDDLIKHPKRTYTSDSSSFVDKWGNQYQYSRSDRTITSTGNGGDPISEKF